MSTSIRPHRSQVAPHWLSWNRFLLYGSLTAVVAVVLAIVFSLSDEGFDVQEVMKVVESSPTRYGPEIKLVDHDGDVSIVVTGIQADAILHARTMDGDENPQHEVIVRYRMVHTMSKKPTAKLTSWAETYKSSMW